MSRYYGFYFRADEISGEYRTAIEQLIAAHDKMPRTCSWVGPVQDTFTEAYACLKENPIFNHPLFTEGGRWERLFGRGRWDSNCPRIWEDQMRWENVTPDQRECTLSDESPQLVIATGINHGYHVIKNFIDWINPGVLGEYYWAGSEEDDTLCLDSGSREVENL